MSDLIFIIPAIIGSLLLILGIGLSIYFKKNDNKTYISKKRKDLKANKKLLKKLKILDFYNWPKNKSGIVLASGLKHKKYINNNFVIKNLDKDTNKTIPLTKLVLVKSLKRTSTVIAPTGSGKTQALLLPSVVYNAYCAEKPNMIITDPKGEIFDSTAKILSVNGYHVIKISTINKILDDFNYETDFWNPLENIIFYHQKLLNSTNQLEIQEINSIITDEIVFLVDILGSKKNPIKDIDDDYWSKNSLILLSFGVALMLLKVELGEWDYSKVNFANLFRNLTNLPNSFENLIKFIKFIQSTNLDKNFKTLWVLKYFTGWYSDHDDNLRSFLNNANTSLNVFASTYFQLLTSKSTFNIDQLILANKPFVIFFTSNILGSSSPSETKLLKTYLESVYKKIDYYKNLNDNVKDKVYWWFLDEVGNLDFLKFLESIATAGRGMNQFALPIFQSMNQINKKYSETLTENCEYRILFNNSNTQLARQIRDQEGFEEKELPSANVVKIDNVTAAEINNIESGYIGLWTSKKNKDQRVFYKLPITYFYMISSKYFNEKITKLNSSYDLSSFTENINFMSLINSLSIQNKRQSNEQLVENTTLTTTGSTQDQQVNKDSKEIDLNNLTFKIDFSNLKMTKGEIYIATGKLLTINKIFDYFKGCKTIQPEDKKFEKLKYIYYELQVFMSNFVENKIVFKDLNYFIETIEMTGVNEFYDKK